MKNPVLEEHLKDTMWFPSRAQWLVMWAGLIIAGILGSNFGDGYRDIEDALGAIFGVLWVVVAALFVVWMIEGRRRKTSKVDNTKSMQKS